MFALHVIELKYQSVEDKYMKILKIIFRALVSLVLVYAIFYFDKKGVSVGCSVASVLLGLAIPWLLRSFQDSTDNTEWKTSQRKLKRGGFINDDTIIRISFAYLYRIKIGDKYLLVKNERGTGKYQPVGGVYKLKGNEKLNLKRLYHVKDDNKVSIDESSRDDYRLRLESKYLRKFVKRFNSKAEREQINNLGREFNEELVEKGIVDWDRITYRYCGRHMTALGFSKHFQTYELLLADVLELIPTDEQEKDLQSLIGKESDAYIFAKAEEILSLGINTETKSLVESIGDHTINILEESEDQLMKISGVDQFYSVKLR